MCERTGLADEFAERFAAAELSASLRDNLA
jgi:hypothetical protein